MSTIAWVIPRLIEGSGGHRTILQHAYALEKAGYQCPIYIEGTGNQAKAAEIVEQLFGHRFLSVRFGWDAIQPADLVMATIWYSAAIVRDLPFNCHKGYFVQDYEAMFYPMGDAYLSAESSYRYGLTPITIGSWLKQELANRFKVPTFHIDFCVDNCIYHPLNKDRELSVCFIYQPDKPRRCSRIGVEALGIVKHYQPEVKIYLYGSSRSEKGHIWYEHEHLGLLKLEDCNALYNRCAVGLCLSSSNPSRIPFEMMAAGLPVVEFWRENNLYDIPPSAVSLSGQTPESLAKNILRLLADSDERARMSKAGVTFMANRPLQDESDQFKACVKSILEGQKPKLVITQPLYDRPPITFEESSMALPANIRKNLVLPTNANLNCLPMPIRGILGWGVRKARKLLLNQ